MSLLVDEVGRKRYTEKHTSHVTRHTSHASQVQWERCIDTVRCIFNKWNELGDDHHVTVLLFCRVVTHTLADPSALPSLLAATPIVIHTPRPLPYYQTVTILHVPDLPPTTSKCSDYCRVVYEGPVPKEPIEV